MTGKNKNEQRTTATVQIRQSAQERITGKI